MNTATSTESFLPADPEPADLPALGVCGWSGSGKTTLIEGMLPALSAQGLRIAVAKHDVHGIDVDRPGKDSDRLFRAGADVLLQGPQETLRRSHDTRGLLGELRQMSLLYDLILVEGRKHSPLPKLWLLSEDRESAPPDTEHVLAALPRGPGRAEAALAFIGRWLPEQQRNTRLIGCVLGTGAASGQVERASALFMRLGVDVVVVGGSRIQAGASLWLPAPPGAHPYAGLLRAMRLAPHASWLVARWQAPLPADQWRRLLSARRPGVWAIFPEQGQETASWPRTGYYDCRMRQVLEHHSGEPAMTTQLPKAVILDRSAAGVAQATR